MLPFIEVFIWFSFTCPDNFNSQQFKHPGCTESIFGILVRDLPRQEKIRQSSSFILS